MISVDTPDKLAEIIRQTWPQLFYSPIKSMKISISSEANPNYLAKLVSLENLMPHPNADRLQIAIVDNNSVITSLSAKEKDLYVFFPLECEINKDFLSWGNCFEDRSLNQDKEAKGFFHKTGRVRAVKLRNQKSEGYLTPASAIEQWFSEVHQSNFKFNSSDVNKEFDTIGDIKICKKYVTKVQTQKTNKVNKNQRKVVREPKVVENQFKFHADTIQLKKSIHNVSPEDYISITKKLHGTSWVAAKLLCNKKLTWFEKLLKKFGINIKDTHYDLLWASRRVLKNGFLETGNKEHFYSYDLWEEIAKSVEYAIQDSISLYGEAVGYTKFGSYIQDGYDYGCIEGEFKTFIYRITTTNPSGQVYEFSHNQIKEYCNKFGLQMVPELYYGKAKDLYPELSVDVHWHQNFLERLMQDYLEKDCEICRNKVPDEGVCVRRDIFDVDIYKLKSFTFLERETKELDKGIVNIEDDGVDTL